MADGKVGRPKNPEKLYEKVLAGKEVDYANVTNKEFKESIETLAKMYNELKEEKISLRDLRQIKNSLKKQFEKLDKIAPDKVIETTPQTPIETSGNTPEETGN